MQGIGQVEIFQVALKETHVMEVKRIFIYLNETTEFGLWYPKENVITMVTYIDVGWVGNIDEKISTSGVKFYLGDF
jgi:hypothetical protein